MTKPIAKALEAQTAQREESQRVTFAMLKSKARSEEEILVTLGGEQFPMLYRAVGAQEWDALISNNPPNTEQKADGHSFNPDKFGPALLAKTCIDPKMTMKEWTVIWNSPDWSRGEITDLYTAALRLSNKGLDIPFTDKD